MDAPRGDAMDGDQVRRLQGQLTEMGYDPGPVDGQMGERTQAAAEQLRSDLQARLNLDLSSGDFAELVSLLARGGWRVQEMRERPDERAVEAISYLDSLLQIRSPNHELVRELQRHLRMLGYLRKGIDGLYGSGTENAVQALQYDLLHNDGSDYYGGASAPVRVMDYNDGRVREITGEVDTATAACLRDMLEDPEFPLLPNSDQPREENARIRDRIGELTSEAVPIPYLRAVLEQESGLRYFEVPTERDADNFIVVGLDHNDRAHPYRITSRGYGAGQYTLFHHPPRQDEIRQFMLTVEGNLTRAMQELRDKFDHFVNGATSQTTADDRVQEHGRGALRLCVYEPADERYLTDCAQCMRDAGTTTITAGETPFYTGSSGRYERTQYHRKSPLTDVPIRRRILCDWPYAVRRYNGSGVNSYWYQSKVLRRIR